MFRQLIALIVVYLFAFVQAKTGASKNDPAVFLYACAGVVLFVIVFIGLYILKQICPEGPRFTAIEIDEIRLERLDDIETNLQKNINALKSKLEFHRKKKTIVQTDRDIKRRLGERVEKFNDKGRSIYGDAWDEGDIPIKDVVMMTQDEVKGLRREAEQIVQTRQEEEKADLWKLWNDVRDDNIPHAGNVKRTSTAIGSSSLGPPSLENRKLSEYTAGLRNHSSSFSTSSALSLVGGTDYRDKRSSDTDPIIGSIGGSSSTEQQHNARQRLLANNNSGSNDVTAAVSSVFQYNGDTFVSSGSSSNSGTPFYNNSNRSQSISTRIREGESSDSYNKSNSSIPRNNYNNDYDPSIIKSPLLLPYTETTISKKIPATTPESLPITNMTTRAIRPPPPSTAPPASYVRDNSNNNINMKQSTNSLINNSMRQGPTFTRPKQIQPSPPKLL